MQQTQDHAIVLAALAVPSIIVVVTKTDAATPERVNEVRSDALARSARIFGFTPTAIDVAALPGTHIDQLKSLITSTLSPATVPAKDVLSRTFMSTGCFQSRGRDSSLPEASKAASFGGTMK